MARKRKSKKPLTPKQQRFIDEYLIDLNASAAYQRAGYTAKGNAAEAAAARLLRNVKVAAAVQSALQSRSARTQITTDDVLRELSRLAFSDLGDVLDASGTDFRLKPASTIPEAARRTIASIKTRRYTEGRGDDAREVEVVEFKLWDKIAALEKIARHLGMFKAVGPDGEPLPIIGFEVVRALKDGSANGKNGHSNGQPDGGQSRNGHA